MNVVRTLIGLADFLFVFYFSGESLIICLRSILIFHGLSYDFFLSSVHFNCLKEGKIHYQAAKT